MDPKEQLTTLIRIACAHKVQGNQDKADLAFKNAVNYFLESKLPVEDFFEVEDEYYSIGYGKVHNNVQT